MAIDEVYKGDETQEEKDEKERKRRKKEEEDALLKKKKEEEEEEEKKLGGPASSGPTSNLIAKTIVGLGMMTASELAHASPEEMLKLNDNDLTDAFKSHPALGLLKTLDPNYKIDPAALGKELNAWNQEHGNTPLNQLSPNAISMHPLMQIPGVQTFVNAFTKEVNKQVKGKELSPEMQAGVDFMNNATSEIGDATPVKSLTGRMAQKMIGGVAKMAAKFAVGSMTAVQNLEKIAAGAAGLEDESAQQDQTMQSSDNPKSSSKHAAGQMFRKLTGLFNGPASMKPTPPGTAPAPASKTKSTLADQLKGAMRPSPPTGGSGGSGGGKK